MIEYIQHVHKGVLRTDIVIRQAQGGGMEVRINGAIFTVKRYRKLSAKEVRAMEKARERTPKIPAPEKQAREAGGRYAPWAQKAVPESREKGIPLKGRNAWAFAMAVAKRQRQEEEDAQKWAKHGPVPVSPEWEARVNAVRAMKNSPEARAYRIARMEEEI